MSKTFNRAFAKAYRDEQREKELDERHKRDVRAELAVMDYMEKERPTPTTLGCLLGAIDTYVEQLTGDKYALWQGDSAYRKRCWEE